MRSWDLSQWAWASAGGRFEREAAVYRLVILPNLEQRAGQKHANFLKMLEFAAKPAKVLQKVPFVL